MVDDPSLISLNTTPPDNPISLDTGNADIGSYMLSPTAVRSRAARYSYAVSNTKAAKSEDEISSAIQNGNESDLRKETASTINADLGSSRQDLLMHTIASKPGPLTPEDMTNIDIASGYNFPYKYPRDPKSIFEINLGKQFVNEFRNFAQQQSDTNFWNYGQLVARNDMEAAQIFGDTATARNQYLITKYQQADAMVQQQSTVGYAADLGKLMEPILNPYYELKMRNNVPGVGFFAGGDVGSNLEAQRLQLNSLPFEQYTATVDAIYNNHVAKNPQAAQIWLAAMMGQSTQERILNAANTIGQFLDVPLIFKVGKVGYSGLALTSQIRTGLNTALKASSSPTAVAADIKASVGDARSAGRINAANLLTGRIEGSLTPMEEAIRVLPENMNIMNKEIEDATFLPQAFQNNLLQETTGAISAGLRILMNTLRPTRIDFANITLEALQALEAKVIRKFAGDNNNVLRISPIVREPFSNTSYHTIHWGNDAGTYFENPHQAADRVLNKGLHVTYTPEQLADLDARIAVLKEDIKTPPSMHEDTAGLNYYYSLQDTLKTLEEKRAIVSKRGGALIKQQGDMFYAEFNVPVRETERTAGDLVINPNNPLDVSPSSWTSIIPYFNHGRTAEDTFSVSHSAQRKAALFPQAVFDAMMIKEGKNFTDFLSGKLKYDQVTGELNPFWKQGIPGVRRFANRKIIDRMNQVLDYSQKTPDPKNLTPTKEIDGWWMTPTELNDHYIRTYHEAPTLAEVHAYEAIKRMDELDRWWTQTAVYRGQAMRGNLNHQIFFNAKDGTRITSPEFVAAPLEKLPGSRGNILVVGKDLASSAVHTFPEDVPEKGVKSKPSVKSLGRTSLKDKQEWNSWVEKGTHKLVKVDSPESMPFKDMGIKDGDAMVHFVLTPNIQTSALKWDSVPRTGGGRFVYDYPYYLKFPRMKFESVGGSDHSVYLGDHAVGAVAYKAVGEDVAKKANLTVKLIKAGRNTEAKAHFINNGLEGALEPWKDFRSKFEGFKDESGVWHEPMYNKHDEFVVVPRNKSIIDMPGKNLETKYGPKGTDRELRNTWRNGLSENNPERNFQVQFTQQRDAQKFQDIQNIGTLQNPIYKREPAQKIDPLIMLNRAMRSTVNSLFMDDYKSFAVNSFLREAMDKLKQSETEVWSSPYAVFKTLSRDSFLSGTPQEEVNRLMANHYKIEQFVGTPTVLDTFVHSVAQSLADATYNRYGPRAASKVVPEWLLPKLRDPFSFLRSVTFNAYLGVFSIPQLLVQSMNYINMFAISPTHAITGTYGAFLHHLSLFNRSPEVLDMLDKLASKMTIPGLPSFKRGEWLESINELNKTGLKYVGAEHGMLNVMHRNNIIKSGFDRFLEWGRKPFQWGEANSRVGAWFIAMKEFRTKNPTGRLTDTDRALILQRADFLQGNMSTASHSAMNAGILSTATQFYMYSARLAEIFWSGSRLGGTRAERTLARARLLAVNGAMFGVPMAFGITGLPAQDYLRRELLDNGYFGFTPPYVVGKSFIESLINEGVIAGGVARATGKWMNIGPREGLGGLTPFKDALTGDLPLLRIAGGASASLTMNTLNNGLYPFMYQLMNGNWGHINTNLVLDNFKEAQTISSAMALYTAWTTGKHINKNSDYISDVTKAQAAAMFLTGLKPTAEQADVFPKEEILKGRNETHKYGLKQFALWMNRGMLASANGDKEQAAAYRDQALSWLPTSDFDPERLGAAILKAFKGAEPLIDRIDPDFYILKAIPKQRDKLRETYRYVRQQRDIQRGRQ